MSWNACGEKQPLVRFVEAAIKPGALREVAEGYLQEDLPGGSRR
jgi:hypothetical protein